MAIFLIGINHTTAGISVREKVVFAPELVKSALREIELLLPAEGAVILSTCNRTEVYVECAFQLAGTSLGRTGAEESDLDQFKAVMLKWLSEVHHIEQEELLSCCYSSEGREVVEHLMRVASGLDSMILGEPQIFGQIKSAFAVSQEENLTGSGLGRAFRDAFFIAKKVRTETAIGKNPVSIAYAAVTLSERIFSNLNVLSVLLLGASRTNDLVMQHLTQKGVANLTVANRTLENAEQLAKQHNASSVLLSEVPSALESADIVVTSTNSQLPLIGKGIVERALRVRKHRPILFLDLAVPRDVEEEVGDIADAYLYTIDDISAVVNDGVRSRVDAAVEAKQIIARGVDHHFRALRSLNAVETLRAYRKKASVIQEKELEKAFKALEKGELAEEVMVALARSITNKLTHEPSVQLKKFSEQGRQEAFDLTTELLGLDQK